MAGSIPTMTDTSGGGVKTVADLYSLINGSKTTKSGGGTTVGPSTITTVHDMGISSESMDAMLRDLLSGQGGIPGLAAVSSGQRIAGGYSSSVNQLLTNDLLTRSAAQVAMAQKHETTTTTNSGYRTSVDPTETVVDGVSADGIAKLLGTLGLASGAAALAPGITDTVKGIYDSISGGVKDVLPSINLGGATSTSTPVTNRTGSVTVGPLSPSSAGEVDGGYGSYNPMDSAGDGNAGDQEATDYYTNATQMGPPDPSGGEDNTPTITPEMTSAAEEEGNDEYADGGLVMSRAAFADGGRVQKKSQGIIGTQSNVVIDPRTGLRGSYAPGFNNASTAQYDSTGVSNVSPVIPSANPGSSGNQNNSGNPGNSGGPVTTISPVTQENNSPVTLPNSVSSIVSSSASPVKVASDNRSVSSYESSPNYLDPTGEYGTGPVTTGDVGSAGRILSTIGGLTKDSGLSTAGGVINLASSKGVQNFSDIGSRILSGDATQQDVSQLSSSGKILGNLTGNQTLTNISRVGQIASSSNPVATGAQVVGDIATKGVYSKLKNLYDVASGGLTTTSGVDAIANLNPIAGVINGLLDFSGKASIGKIVSNAVAQSNPDSFAKGESLLDKNANSTGEAKTANAVSDQTGADPLDVLVAIVQNSGTKTNPMGNGSYIPPLATSTDTNSEESGAANTDSNPQLPAPLNQTGDYRGEMTPSSSNNPEEGGTDYGDYGGSSDQGGDYSSEDYGDYGVPMAETGGGNGHGDCVHVDSVLPTGGRAGDVKVGDILELADSDTLVKSSGIVSVSFTKTVPGYKITTVSGVTLICSDTAPIPTYQRGLVKAPNLGEDDEVAILTSDGPTWDLVSSVLSVGLIQVQHITVGDKCFWAGEKSTGYILHHNVKNMDDGSNGFGGYDGTDFGAAGGETEAADGGRIVNKKRGGKVSGPGTGTSDSIKAKLSQGEYVISADVVKMPGVLPALEALQKKYHVPAAVQKLKNFARK